MSEEKRITVGDKLIYNFCPYCDKYFKTIIGLKMHQTRGTHCVPLRERILNLSNENIIEGLIKRTRGMKGDFMYYLPDNIRDKFHQKCNDNIDLLKRLKELAKND